jgi:hypothetical protein
MSGVVNFSGLVQEVQIYNAVITSAQVNELILAKILPRPILGHA